VFDVTPLEMASAYSAIPNGGIHETAYFVDRVEDRTGKVIVEHSPNPTRAVSARSACLATRILENNVQSGTGTNARLGAQPAAGKTGTTEGNSNTWFVGYTPYLTTAVWMGIPSEGTKSMGNLAGQEQFGGLWPATIWRNFNRAWLDTKQKPIAGFPACAPALRPGQPAAGASDPYGILNGGTVPEPEAGPITTQQPGRSTTTTVPRSTTTRVPRTTTTSVDPTTTSVITLPPPDDLG
jgi:penicillin-binding protein 1A